MPKKASTYAPQLVYEAETSKVGFERLLTGKTEVAALDCPLTGVEKAALAKAFPDPNRHPREIAFCRAATVLVVPRSNRIRGLTIEQAERIYRAEIDKWSAVAGLEQGITRMGTVLPRMSAWLFTHDVLHDRFVEFPDKFKYDRNHLPKAEELKKFREAQQSRFPGGGPYACYETDGKLLDEVSKKSNAIGYCALLPETDRLKNVRMVSIASSSDQEPEPPIRDGVISDTYPLQREVRLLVHPDAPDSTKAFVEFTCSSKASQIAHECGLWLDADLKPVRGLRRLADFKAGKGTPITAYSIVGRKQLLQDLALKFVKAKATVQMNVEKKGNWDEAFAKYSQGEIDFFLTNETATEEEMSPNDTKEETPKAAAKDSKVDDAKDKAKEPKHQRVELGQMAVGIVVHPENLLESLPMRELRGILSGEIKKWPGMKDSVAKMHLVGLDLHDPITALLKERLAESAPDPNDPTKTRYTPTPLAKYAVEPNTEKVLLAVASNPSAIGFVDLSQVSPKEKSVKIIPVFVKNDPARKPGKEPKPTEKADSPLVRTLFLHVSPKASQTAKDFAEYVASGDCRETLLQHGLIPPSSKVETVQRKPELPDLKEFAKRNQAAKEPTGNKGNAVAAVPAVNLPDPDQDGAKAKAKSAQNTDAPVALPDVPKPSAEPWRTALEGTGTPSTNASSPPFGEPKRPVDSPKKSSSSSGREPTASSSSSAIGLFAIAGTAGLVIVVFVWVGSMQRKRKRR